MIRASNRNPKNPSIFMGLTEGNVIRLKNGQPISISLRSCGIDLPGDISVLYGPTEADIEFELRQAGLISPATKFTVDPKVNQERAILGEYDHVLVVMVGLPRSGKSTWSKSQAWPVVNPDAIRLAIHGQRFNAQAEPFVWLFAKTMIRSLFRAGHRIVVFDATSITRKRRDDLRSVEWMTYFKHIDTPKEVCIQRAGDDLEMVGVIERMAAQLEPLGEDEPRWP